MWYQGLLKKTPSQGIPLPALKKGEQGFIYAYQHLSIDGISQLQNLGLGPGEPFTILYTYPCYLLEVGGGRVAFDRELAFCIHVLPQEGRGVFL